MDKFKKLNRKEMKKVLGGYEGCGTCGTSGGCSNETIGAVPCPDAPPDTFNTSCQSCVCNGKTYYPCRAF
jgi:hypothetical protein